MANTVDYDKYYDIMRKAAREAVAEADKIAKKIGSKGLGKPGDEAYDRTFNDYLNKLMDEYPYDDAGTTENVLNLVANFPAKNMRDFLYRRGSTNPSMSPTQYYDYMKSSEVLPLLQGVAKEGNDWYSMPIQDLLEKGADFGYPVSEPAGRADFLKRVADAQTKLDRAKLVKEVQDSTDLYAIKKLITPTAWNEFENALATGGDYDKGDMWRTGATDALTNAFIATSPGSAANVSSKLTPLLQKLIPATKGSFVTGIANPAIAMGSEGARQILAEKTSNNGIEAELSPVITTGAAGATIPALVGSVQRLVSKIPGKQAQQFARGLAKANKAGDPAELEAEAIEDVVNTYNKGTSLKKAISDANKSAERWKQAVKDVEDIGEMNGWVTTSGVRSADIKPDVPISMELNEAIKLLNTNKVPEYAKALGVAPNNGQYSASEILKAYKKPIRANVGVNKDGKYVLVEDNPLFSANNPLLTAEEKVPGMSPKELSTFQRLFPARYAEAAQANKALDMGYKTGNIIGTLGGAIESTFKPVSIDNVTRAISGDARPDYQRSTWYNKMDKHSKKLFDAILKKKEEEDEEE